MNIVFEDGPYYLFMDRVSFLWDTIIEVKNFTTQNANLGEVQKWVMQTPFWRDLLRWVEGLFCSVYSILLPFLRECSEVSVSVRMVLRHIAKLVLQW